MTQSSSKARAKSRPMSAVPEFSFEESAAVRLVQIYVYARDLTQSALQDRAPKVAAVRELLKATGEWFLEVHAPTHLAALALLKPNVSLD